MKNKIIGAIGPKGSGKTHSVAEYIRTLDRVAVFDLVHEAGYISDNSEIYQGTLQQFGQSLLRDNFCSIYRPTKYSIEGDLVVCPSFETIVKLCYLRGNMTLVIDEAHLLCTSRSCPPMLTISNLIGRHRQLSLVYVAQSFAAITRPLTRNTDEFWFWRIIEPVDLDGIRDRCGRDTADRVQNLRKLEQGNNGIIPGEMVKWNIWEGTVTPKGMEDERQEDSL